MHVKLMKAALEGFGYTCGPRDPNMNFAFEGKLMVAEHYEKGFSQADGQGGLFCIVGDNLDELINTAFETVLPDLSDEQLKFYIRKHGQMLQGNGESPAGSLEDAGQFDIEDCSSYLGDDEISFEMVPEDALVSRPTQMGSR